MNNERFMVPEALFHPTDIGLNQAGVRHYLQQFHSLQATLTFPLDNLVPVLKVEVSALLSLAGLAETVVQSVEAVHEDLHGLLYSNVLITGTSDAVEPSGLMPASSYHQTNVHAHELSAMHQMICQFLLSHSALAAGGTAKCPGFKERLYSELRRLVPSQYTLNVHLPEDPACAAVKGGARLAASPLFQHLAWTKLAYEEHGSARLHGHGDSARVI